MEFVKRLLVKVRCPSIEESDTKGLSPDISRELTFSLVTSFACKTEEVYYAFFLSNATFSSAFQKLNDYKSSDG